MVPVTKSFIEVFQELRITKAQFVRELGIAKMTLENILTEKNLPSLKIIYRLLELYPWINPTWLLTNQGAMKLKDAEDYERLEQKVNEQEQIIRDLRLLVDTQNKAISLLEKMHKNDR